MCEHCKCNDLNIPQYLHLNNREPEQNFEDENELVFIRFQNEGKIQPDGRPSRAIFKTTEQSFNRGKYSESPEDVLYDIEEGKHFFGYGIVQSTVKNIKDKGFPHPELDRIYKLKSHHGPKECMYPHSIIKIYYNGQEQKGRLSSKDLKMLIRDYYCNCFHVLKKPEL